jgi:hypothetical protein
MIKELIGCSEVFGLEEEESVSHEMPWFKNSSHNYNSKSFSKRDFGFRFINRE